MGRCLQGNEGVMVYGSNFGPVGSAVFAQYFAVEGVWSVISLNSTNSNVAAGAPESQPTAPPPANFTAADCQVGLRDHLDSNMHAMERPCGPCRQLFSLVLFFQGRQRW